MDLEKISQKITSCDRHEILGAVWDILGCTDQSIITKLAPHVDEFKKAVNKVDLGGMFYSNANHFNLAMSYIMHMAKGGCRCFIYKNAPLLGPVAEAKRNHIRILSSSSNNERYEVCYEVECQYCGGSFFVTETHGGHVPWFQWQSHSI